ncbi:MAG: hypothetical protein ACREDM_16215 [Methylocella sp.]
MRANALLPRGAGPSCEKAAGALLLDGAAIRKSHGMLGEDGSEGLARFAAGTCQASGGQQEQLKAWAGETLPGSTPEIGAFAGKECGVVFEGRLSAVRRRLGLEYHKPEIVPRKRDEEKRKAFIEADETRLNAMAGNAAVLFMDAVHPTQGLAGRPDAGRPNKRSSRPCKRAGAGASTFTARPAWNLEQRA